MGTFRKRRWLFAALLVAGIIFSSWLCRPGPPYVSPEIEEQIQVGMTQRQVEELLGAPAGDYTTRRAVYGGLQRLPLNPDFPFGTPSRKSYLLKAWTTNHGEMKVLFDQRGHVVGKAFNEPVVCESLLEAALTTLGLRQPRGQCLN
jgi:hypothetical protein